ncbi:hypothetical protein [Spirillospora sp. CA-128828]|uniref:hypothetical protein n=1 Tax=Spirillospora sp. CA-128828 TaxID=3240033 RepID=UPI003D94A73B
MALGDLDLEQWRSLSDRDAEQLAGRIAERTGAEVVEIGRRAGGRYALFRRADSLYGLVPGGDVQVGYDGGRFTASPRQLASYAESYEEYGAPGEDYGLPAEIGEYVDMVTSPPRTAQIPPLLVAVDARDAGLTRVAPDHPLIAEVAAHAGDRRELRLTWPPGARPARQACIMLDADGSVTDAWLMFSLADDISRMADEGMRLLTPDEWEHACGGGATTLFRWGDDCPTDRYPTARMRRDGEVVSPTGPQLEPNAFGLNIAQDPYRYERTADSAVCCGGDGGGMIGGGAGFFCGWLTLATAFRDDAHTEQTVNEARDLLVRPAIPLV